MCTYRTVGTHESVPTEQRERMVVDPVNQYQNTAVPAPDDWCQQPKHVELHTEM